jgi:serine/threonine protein kinase
VTFRSVPTTEPKPASTYGPYRTTETLVTGVQDAVYLAERADTGARVALRVLADDAARDEILVRALRDHAGRLAALSARCPAIATVHECGVTPGGGLYLALEHPVGVTLAEALRRDGPFRPERAVRLAIGIAEPLEAAHMMGVVHGCLRPEDVVLVGPDEGVKLTQFGLDWVRTSRGLSRRGARVVGAPYTPYEAPEQLLTGEATHQSDVFAVGALLYEMLTGRPPGSRPPTRRRGGVLPLRKLRPDASRTLERIVMRALSPVPSRRHRDMTDLFNDLWSEISPFSSARRQDRGTGHGGRGGRTRALVAAGVLVVAAGAAILLGAAWLGERDSLPLLRQPAPTPAEVASPLPPVAPTPLPPAPALPPAVTPLPTPPSRPAVRDVVPSPVPPVARVVPPRSAPETASKPVAVDVPWIPRGARALPQPPPTQEPPARDSSDDGGAIIDWLLREGSAARR